MIISGVHIFSRILMMLRQRPKSSPGQMILMKRRGKTHQTLGQMTASEIFCVNQSRVMKVKILYVYILKKLFDNEN